MINTKKNSSSMHIEDKKKRTYDAIVIGSGMSGGIAAKELCERGLRTLVLERGPKLDHITDYHTALTPIWQFPHHNRKPQSATAQTHPIQSQCYAFNEGTQHLFVRDDEHPYQQIKPWGWIRGYHVGGKSLMWARQSYRMAALELEENAIDGTGCDWPIRYPDLAPWYSHIERFMGINGERNGLDMLPDGEMLPPMPLNVMEKEFQQRVKKSFPNRHVVVGRSANLTARHNGRGPCQYRNLCHRGCPFSAYFSSQSASLPAAAATGKMTLRPDSIVHSIIYDEKKGRATGVRVIDAVTKQTVEYYAKIVFCNAATLNTTLILMNSTSSRFPNGLGNDSGVLGHYLMDHNYRMLAEGTHDGFKDWYYKGRRPNAFYIPRFRNVGADKQSDYLRGYAFGGSCGRQSWDRGTEMDGFGADFKTSMTKPGPWTIFLQSQAEMLPMHHNHVKINHKQPDRWGMPTIDIDCATGSNEAAMSRDMATTMQEMLESSGFHSIRVWDTGAAPGLGIHEVGTARMGRDPKTSVLNGWNQIHAVKNVFVTDGAALPSQGCQNPSLTFMALTARAVDYTVRAMKRREL
jgi:choline dehydrogenase-like flavoprotein